MSFFNVLFFSSAQQREVGIYRFLTVFFNCVLVLTCNWMVMSALITFVVLLATMGLYCRV